jgi:hypothetical protein
LDQKFVRLNSVLDPHGFNIDPDLALCLWIQIQILIQIQIQVAKPVQIHVDPDPVILSGQFSSNFLTNDKKILSFLSLIA